MNLLEAYDHVKALKDSAKTGVPLEGEDVPQPIHVSMEMEDSLSSENDYEDVVAII